MLYESHEDEFDQEDQALLDRIAARYTVTPQVRPVDPLQAWIAVHAQLFGQCLAGAVQYLPEASPADRLHAATVLFSKATA